MSPRAARAAATSRSTFGFESATPVPPPTTRRNGASGRRAMTRRAAGTAGSHSRSAERTTSYETPVRRANDARFSSRPSSSPERGLRIEMRGDVVVKASGGKLFAAGPRRPGAKGRPSEQPDHEARLDGRQDGADRGQGEEAVVTSWRSRGRRLDEAGNDAARAQRLGLVRNACGDGTGSGRCVRPSPSGAEVREDRVRCFLSRRSRLPRVEVREVVEVAVADDGKAGARNLREEVPATRAPRGRRAARLPAPVPQVEGVREPVRLLVRMARHRHGAGVVGAGEHLLDRAVRGDETVEAEREGVGRAPSGERVALSSQPARRTMRTRPTRAAPRSRSRSGTRQVVLRDPKPAAASFSRGASPR